MNVFRNHPWGLIGVKLLCFPVLWIINKIFVNRALRPLRYKIKKVLFFDRFSKFTRRHFYKGITKRMVGQDVKMYRVGPALICLSMDDERTPIAELEWNLSHEYLDIVYPVENPKAFRFVLAEGPYEMGENVVLEKGDYVFDGGASLGVFSFLAAERVGNTGHVFMLEPVPFLCRCLQETINVNRTENVTILRMALGSNNGMAYLRIDREDPSSSKLGDQSGGISVTVRTLDTLVFEERLIPKVNFIKMDIEGSEREALLGGRETIHYFKPKLSICAYHRKGDFEVLTRIIHDIEPDYRLIYGKRKIYGYVE